MTVKQVRLADIVEDSDIMPRKGVDAETVQRYREAYINGAPMPPVVVFQENGSKTLYLADGWHRTRALRAEEFFDCQAEVIEGTKLDAMAFAASANSRHGRATRKVDMPNAIAVVLRRWALMDEADFRAELPDGWRQQDIADRIGVGRSWATQGFDEAWALLDLLDANRLRGRRHERSAATAEGMARAAAERDRRLMGGRVGPVEPEPDEDVFDGMHPMVPVPWGHGGYSGGRLAPVENAVRRPFQPPIEVDASTWRDEEEWSGDNEEPADADEASEDGGSAAPNPPKQTPEEELAERRQRAFYRARTAHATLLNAYHVIVRTLDDWSTSYHDLDTTADDIRDEWTGVRRLAADLERRVADQYPGDTAG